MLSNRRARGFFYDVIVLLCHVVVSGCRDRCSSICVCVFKICWLNAVGGAPLCAIMFTKCFAQLGSSSKHEQQTFCSYLLEGDKFHSGVSLTMLFRFQNFVQF